ncbi:MAG: hypothetical protein DRH08_05265 [Deltaproteobacteria bacterium]|nr:MAG: hypothetical protein DRH08_05265 [Deltaproteobacteria bacterium]
MPTNSLAYEEEFIDVDVFLTKPQEQFIFSDAKFPAIVGGLGSGKTKAGTERLINKLLDDRGANGAYYMPTYDLLKLRVMPAIEEDLHTMGVECKINHSTNIISIHDYGKIILRSYDNPTRIISYETAHSIVDELDTIEMKKARVIWRKVTERNRQYRSTQNTIGLVTTPDQGVHGFVYKKWGKNPQKGYELIRAATASNPYLPDDYIEQIMSNYDSVLAQLYLEGEFVNLTENKVYHFFSRALHHTNRKLEDEDRHIHIGLDFNVGGTTATTWLIEDNNPIAVDEFVSQDTYDFILNLSRYDDRKIHIYPDSTGRSGSTNASASDIGLIENAAQLEGNNWIVNAPLANPLIKNRVNAVNSLLSHNRLSVNTDKCPNLTSAFESQGYNERGEPEKFSEHPSIDDWVDNAGYFIHRRYPITRPASQVVVRF